jgi:hypothetical protein
MLNRRARRWAIQAFISQLGFRAAYAIESITTSPPEEAARKATHPFFDTNTLQLQPNYTDIHEGGNSTQMLVRLALAYKGILIPGLKLGDIYSVARLEMYGESLNPPSSPNVVGLQDWNLLFIGVKPFQWGVQVALGVYAVLPTSTILHSTPRSSRSDPLSAPW